jgi:hypothetical protein
VTSPVVIKNGEEKVAKKEKNRSRKGKQERGGEDPYPQAQWVSELDRRHQQTGKPVATSG